MSQDQLPSPTSARTPEHKLSIPPPLPFVTALGGWPTIAAYIFTLALAITLPFWDGIHNNSPDTHPLQPDRLWLRLLGVFFMVLNFAIFGTVVLRIGRRTVRHRKGLCLTCGYDLRAHTAGEVCPECGTPPPSTSSPIPLTRLQIRLFKIFAALDH
jgi:hypothetical protein